MIFIRPALLEDAKDICNMRWDESTRLYLNDARMFSIEQCKEWLTNLPPSSERWCAQNDGFFAGLIRIDEIDEINNTCAVGLDLTPSVRGRGLSKLIYQKALQDLFNNRNMNCVWLHVLTTNTIALNLYRGLGFKEEGVLRKRVYRGGRYINCISMSLLKEEWQLAN